MAIEKFNFWRSYYEGIRRLPNDMQLEAYMQIMEYMFDGVLPEEKNPAFSFIEHHLNQTLSKIEAGSKGGKSKDEAEDKQNTSKTQAKTKQTLSKDEAKSNQQEQEQEVRTRNKNIEKEEFEIFYENYGKHERNNKKTAFEKWKALIKEKKLPELNFLLQKVDEYKNSLNPADNDQFKAGAQVWLNKERWNDDFPPYRGTKKEVINDGLDALYQAYQNKTLVLTGGTDE